MSRPMRGHQIELPVQDDFAALIDGLVLKGFVRNAFLFSLANAAKVFVKEEEDRLQVSLECEVAPTDLVICREFGDWKGRSFWLSMRKNKEEWILSAVLVEEP
jgi:hypothetical protein